MAAPLHNSYLELPEALRVPQSPAAVPSPDLIAWNQSLAVELGLESWQGDAAARCSGQRLPTYATPVALGYAGHQFGQFVPQLGDGRALLLGERIDAHGVRRDIQLKGSGRTVFSRGGDGKSPLGPVLREYLVSEAMHVLGVPTTRALAAVTTGEQVLREAVAPGAILTRVARSHVRVGSFEFLAAQGDVVGLGQLAEYVAKRFCPDAEGPASLAVFDHAIDVQSTLIAQWMALGFVHGVMNTDNTSLSGETIDYGPCAFMDEFKREKVFSSIDRFGRYAFDQQPVIGAWNLSRLASCLLMVHDDVPAFESRLEAFLPTWQGKYGRIMARKLGLTGVVDDGPVGEHDMVLIDEWLDLLERQELDYTLSWSRLAASLNDDDPELGPFAQRWRKRVLAGGRDGADVAAAMASQNPRIIPRNHQIAAAIEQAEAGNFDHFNALHAALSEPFDGKWVNTKWAKGPMQEERVTQTFCGT